MRLNVSFQAAEEVWGRVGRRITVNDSRVLKKNFKRKILLKIDKPNLQIFEMNQAKKSRQITLWLTIIELNGPENFKSLPITRSEFDKLCKIYWANDVLRSLVILLKNDF